jgi:hypothetical protein
VQGTAELDSAYLWSPCVWALRYSPGATPVHILKARLKGLASEKPMRLAMLMSGKCVWTMHSIATSRRNSPNRAWKGAR